MMKIEKELNGWIARNGIEDVASIPNDLLKANIIFYEGYCNVRLTEHEKSELITRIKGS